MRDALYHPQHGFYRRSDRNPFGTAGDFYTAIQLMPVFGEVVSAYVRGIAPPDASLPFEIVDLGAGRAGLAPVLEGWRYIAVDWNSNLFPAHISGLVFANEFFDALPVHLLQKRNQEWCELLIPAVPDGDVNRLPSRQLTAGLAEYAARYGSFIPEGGLLEVNLEMQTWIDRIAASLRQGRLLVIDYGYSQRELSRFPSGTLMSYQRHLAHDDVLTDRGNRDITALVNFTELRRLALEAGFRLLKESSLSSWVLAQFTPAELELRWREAGRRWQLQWKHLVFGLGEVFRVLEFEKVHPEK